MAREIWHDAMYYRWRGYDYRTGHPTPCPEPGTSAPMGSDWETVATQREADVIEVPYTVWGDYVGSTVERSNYRSLLGDYPETFIEIYGGYWSHVLYLPTFKLSQDLVDVIRGLFDYPLVNEEDHSQLEMEIAWEMWDGWLKSEVEDGLNATYEIDTDDWSDEDWTFIQERYYSRTYEQNYGPESGDATSVHFPFHDQVMDELAEEISTLGLEHDPRRPM